MYTSSILYYFATWSMLETMSDILCKELWMCVNQNSGNLNFSLFPLNTIFYFLLYFLFLTVKSLELYEFEIGTDSRKKKIMMVYAAEINDFRSQINFDQNRHLILQLISLLFDRFDSYLSYFVVCIFQNTWKP